MAAEGIITEESAFAPGETVERLKRAIAVRGMTLFAEIDHAKGAEEAGLMLRPTTLLIFGAAKIGTSLMLADQTMGIDLPLKALVWQDGAGKTWISAVDPVWLAKKHGLSPEPAQIAIAMRQGLDALIKSAMSG
jgi:uncharacterized protein (DUF302 family)